MTELDLDAIEARANGGVRQTTADADVLALVARVRELEAAKVWVVLSHCYEDVRVEDVFDSREQAEAEYDVLDGNGFSTGYEIVEKSLSRRPS